MFTTQELNALYELINRVQISGKEAPTVVTLQQKIQTLLHPPVTGDNSTAKTSSKVIKK